MLFRGVTITKIKKKNHKQKNNSLRSHLTARTKFSAIVVVTLIFFPTPHCHGINNHSCWTSAKFWLFSLSITPTFCGVVLNTNQISFSEGTGLFLLFYLLICEIIFYFFSSMNSQENNNCWQKQKSTIYWSFLYVTYGGRFNCQADDPYTGEHWWCLSLGGLATVSTCVLLTH